MVKRNTRTADFTEDTRVPWWKERIPEDFVAIREIMVYADGRVTVE